MYKVQSMLKMLALTLVFSFFVSCSDDDEKNTNPINQNPGGTTGTIEASELVVSGQMVEMSGSDENPWSLGACPIKAYLSIMDDEDAKIGEGMINSDGSYSITLAKSVKTDDMNDIDFQITGLTFSPDDLKQSSFDVKFYAEINGNSQPIFCKAKSNDGTADVTYSYKFFSADGSAKGETTNAAGAAYGTYNIECKKGWNLIETKFSPKVISTVDALPSNAKTYVFNF